jgi:thiosulfate dehydrogenase (quinone) large subunit
MATVHSSQPETSGLSQTAETHDYFHRALAALRIAFGLTFLWAFFDKLLALGFHTGYSPEGKLDRFGPAAWINGGSPTEGFLKFGADGPFKGFYNSIGGSPILDWLFMLTLLGVGVGLTFGIAMRAATAVGTLTYLLMWSVVLPPENHPFLDEHILGAISMVVLALGHAGNTWGLGPVWRDLPFVKANPALR